MWNPTTRAQHSRAGLRYGSNLTDAEWAIFGPFLPEAAACGRKRSYPMREVINAICYVLRGGIAWRLMADTFPPWRTVYRWFARLFAGSDRGGERAAVIYTLIVTAKLNGVDPRAWLADTLRRIADHPASRLHEPLP